MAAHLFDDIIKGGNAVDHVRRKGCVCTQHPALAHAVTHLRERRTTSPRNRLGEGGVIIVNARLHKTLRIGVEGRIRIPLNLVFASRNQRGRYPFGSHRLRVIEVRLPHADRTDLTTRGDIEFCRRATNPIGSRGGEAIGNRDHRLLFAGGENLVGQFRDTVDAAARTVDIDEDLAYGVVIECVAQRRRKLLRAGTARTRDVVNHVAALSNETVERQHRNPTTP